VQGCGKLDFFEKVLVLLEATPSVPEATFMPPASIAGSRAIPLPNFRLLTGLWTAVTPRSANKAISSSVIQTQWAA
jgi:hypothetical protein